MKVQYGQPYPLHHCTTASPPARASLLYNTPYPPCRITRKQHVLPGSHQSSSRLSLSHGAGETGTHLTSAPVVRFEKLAERIRQAGSVTSSTTLAS